MEKMFSVQTSTIYSHVLPFFFFLIFGVDLKLLGIKTTKEGIQGVQKVILEGSIIDFFFYFFWLSATVRVKLGKTHRYKERLRDRKKYRHL